MWNALSSGPARIDDCRASPKVRVFGTTIANTVSPSCSVRPDAMRPISLRSLAVSGCASSSEWSTRIVDPALKRGSAISSSPKSLTPARSALPRVVITTSNRGWPPNSIVCSTVANERYASTWLCSIMARGAPEPQARSGRGALQVGVQHALDDRAEAGDGERFDEAVCPDSLPGLALLIGRWEARARGPRLDRPRRADRSKDPCRGDRHDAKTAPL